MTAINTHKSFTLINSSYRQGFTFNVQVLEGGNVEVEVVIDETPHVQELSEAYVLQPQQPITQVLLRRPWRRGYSQVSGNLKIDQERRIISFTGNLITTGVAELDLYDMDFIHY